MHTDVKDLTETHHTTGRCPAHLEAAQGGCPMDLRTIVLEELKLLFEEDGLELPTLNDGLVLLDSELDSLGFAVLVARLDERLGYDPFTLMSEPVYPQTLGEFVHIYERFGPGSKKVPDATQ